MSFLQTSYAAKVGLPGEDGTLSISHSTLTDCSTAANVSIKEVGHSINDFKVGTLFDGLTLNIFFSNTNDIFNNNLSLKLDNQPSTANVPIIHSMIYSGSSTTDNAVFLYPRWNKNSIVTFVYRTLMCYVNGTLYDNNNPYMVQQAINADPVAEINSDMQSSLRDFNHAAQENKGTVEITNISLMSNGPTGAQSSGILEIIPVDTTNSIIQRLTNSYGQVQQREKSGSQGQGSQVQIQDSGSTNPLNLFGTTSQPSDPGSGGKYHLVLEIIPAGGCGDTQYVYSQEQISS